MFQFVEVRDFNLPGLDVVFDLVNFFLDIVNLVKYFIEVSLFSKVLDFTDPERKLSEGFFTTDFEKFKPLERFDFGKFPFIVLNNIKIFNENIFDSLPVVFLIVKDVLGSGEFDEGHEVIKQAEDFGGLLVVLLKLKEQRVNLPFVVRGVQVGDRAHVGEGR